MLGRTLLRCPLRPAFGLYGNQTSLRRIHLTCIRFNTQLPKSTDKKGLQSNDWSARVPQFPFGKESQPTIIPKANTPRVSKTTSFKDLIDILKSSKEPEVVYVAESHRLYFVACAALAFVVCYNIFDFLERSIRVAYNDYVENPLDQTPQQQRKTLTYRALFITGVVTAIGACGIVIAAVPSRLVRRIEYLPGPVEHIRLVSHPLLPGKPSPVITIPLEKVRLGSRSKVWTGSGFYGASNKHQFFFYLHEKGKFAPWIVDRNGWFWGDARVYDVLFGKEPVEVAEKGLSYDDVLKIKMNLSAKGEAQLRRELGPAWRVKTIGKLMKEDATKASSAAKRALQSTTKQKKLSDK